MNISSKIIGIIIISLVVGIAIGYVIGNTEESKRSIIPEQSNKTTIGLILPLSGDLSTHGEENWEGAKLGIADFNEHLEELDAEWRLEMISEDSATNPGIAREKINHLYSKGIDIIVGPETSENTEKVRKYSDSNDMLLVSCCSSAPALSIPNDSVFRLVPDDTHQGTALAKLIHHEEIKVIIPIWREDTWGKGLSGTISKSFGKLGGIVDPGISYDAESPEFSASTSLLAEKVQKYVDEYQEDKVAVVFLGFAEILKFTQAASEHNILDDVRWFGPGAVTKEQKLVENPIGLEFSTNVELTTVQVTVTKNETYERVKDILTEKLGRDPSTFAYSSYDAVWIIGLAMLESNSTEASIIKAKIPEIAENHKGAIGLTKLNSAGDLEQADYDIWGIRNGEWILLGKYVQETESIIIK